VAKVDYTIHIGLPGLPMHNSSVKEKLPKLSMRNISKCFGATVALDNVDIAVYPGEIHALIGENGAGKSTLMKVLSGAIAPDKGQMELDGKPYHPHNPLAARTSGIGMIYQELSLAGHLTVEENILLGMEPSVCGLIKRKDVRQKTAQALSYFDHPEITPGTKVCTLSVGAQQLVEIARAIAVGCQILVFDEPTSSLSGHDVQRLFKLIKQLKDRGMAIIYISHFLEEIKEIADSFTVLRDGKSVGSGNITDTSTENLISLMVGRELGKLYPRSNRTSGKVLMEITDLAGAEKPTQASFELHQGEVLGIAGLVGAGRTEMIRAIFGLDSVKKGKIRIGSYFGPASPIRRWSEGVGLLSEDRKCEGLALSMSLADNITMTNLSGFGPLGMIIPARQLAAAKFWIDKLNVKCQGPKQKAVDLSGGNQQKVAIARLLQHNVDILLLDEPTRGIDVGSKKLIYELIDKIACGDKDKGIHPKAVLIISSYLPELLGICDRIAVMCRGRLNPAHLTKEVSQQQIMFEATGSNGRDKFQK